MTKTGLPFLLCVLTAGCMTSHPNDITPLSSMTQTQTFSGYIFAPSHPVEVRCRPPGDDTETVVTTTLSSTAAIDWDGVDLYYWSATTSVPSQCWTPVAPGQSGANAWGWVDDREVYRVNDFQCLSSIPNLGYVPECSSAAAWTRLVAPDGSSPGADPLSGNPMPTVIASGLSFAEGPMWEPENDRLLFTDIETDTIWQVTPGGTPSAISSGSGTHTNGQAKWLKGPVVRCEHATQRVTMDGTVVASTYGGQPFNSPNDAAVSLDGTIYFTDPTYGSNPAWGGANPVLGFQGVYRVDPEEAPVLEASWTNRQPNGIAFAPDFATLYVADTQAGEVLSFSVGADGSLGPEQHFAWVTQADGMAVDVDGNLYVTGSAGLTVLAPSGSAWGVVPFTNATNCAFGGPDRDTLFVTTRSTVYALDLPIPGTPSAF